jgi:hypothetical protein
MIAPNCKTRNVKTLQKVNVILSQFYQVCCDICHRNFLRFLWWKNEKWELTQGRVYLKVRGTGQGLSVMITLWLSSVGGSPYYSQTFSSDPSSAVILTYFNSYHRKFSCYSHLTLTVIPAPNPMVIAVAPPSERISNFNFLSWLLRHKFRSHHLSTLIFHFHSIFTCPLHPL